VICTTYRFDDRTDDPDGPDLQSYS
jgi:hypothetical protein